MDYNNHNSVVNGLAESQESDYDLREQAREAHHFIDKRDGQWDPGISMQFDQGNKPRYTFDKTGPIIDQICGEVNAYEYAIKVRPFTGAASEDNAKIFEGMVRMIQNISNAEDIYSLATRMAITSGIDGFYCKQDYIDPDSFDQDLFIKKLHNYIDRVWWDSASEERDHSDADWCIVLHRVTHEGYKEEFGTEKSPTSLSTGRQSNVYWYKDDSRVIIGQLYYKKSIKTELVQMSNGAVYEDDDKFQQIANDLALEGIREVNRREKSVDRVYTKWLDGAQFLTEDEETAFGFIPVASMYGNFKITEDKRIYRGAVERLMDPQRTYNTERSRQLEENALAPRDKFFMTSTQVSGYEDTLSTMNVNNDPVQLYNHDPEAPPPFRVNAAQVNPGLAQSLQASSDDMNAIAGLYNANMGDNPRAQSGLAIDIQVSQGNKSLNKWIEMREVAIAYMGKVLVNAIPRVYDSTRMVKILNEDGSFEEQTINQRVLDRETNTIIELNNLSAGEYDVVCESGISYKSRQREAANTLVELGRVIPEVLQMGGDVILDSVQMPGADTLKERYREQLINSGMIPQDQWTDEERAKIEQSQAVAAQQQTEDPATKIAEAEMMKGQAEVMNAQNRQTELQIQVAKLQSEQRAQQEKLQSHLAVESAKIDQGQQKLDLQADEQTFNRMIKEQQQQLDQLAAQMKLMMDQEKLRADNLNKQADTLNKLKEATGADAIINPKVIKSYDEQAEIIQDEQQEQ